MAFPSELSVVRLRATWIRADGAGSPGILSIRSRYFTGVGTTIVTPAPFEVRLSDGKLDIPIPLGDDPDLSSPLQLEITARLNGIHDPQVWTVEATAADVETVTENGSQVKFIDLRKLLVVDGVPLIPLGLVKSVEGIKPDAFGNVDLPDFLTAATLDLRLAAYTKSADLGKLIRDQVAAMLVQGSGIGLTVDPFTGYITVTNTGNSNSGGSGSGGTTTPTSGFGLAAFGTSPFGGS